MCYILLRSVNMFDEKGGRAVFMQIESGEGWRDGGMEGWRDGGVQVLWSK